MAQQDLGLRHQDFGTPGFGMGHRQQADPRDIIPGLWYHAQYGKLREEGRRGRSVTPKVFSSHYNPRGSLGWSNSAHPWEKGN